MPPLRQRGRHHGARQEGTAAGVRGVQLVVVTITWLVCMEKEIEIGEREIPSPLSGIIPFVSITFGLAPSLADKSVDFGSVPGACFTVRSRRFFEVSYC